MKKLYLLFSLLTLTISPTFAQFLGGSGGGGAFAAAGSPGGEVALPIQLIYFTALSTGEQITTTWATASQTNNDYFTVERAADGINFQELGTVNGAGNNNRTLNYSFIDEEPLAGKTYYRLKQTDFDGKFEYSNIAVVTNSINKLEIQLYPNPSKGSFIIAGTAQNADLVIINSLGQKVTTQKISSLITDIDMSNSADGIYYVYINSGKETIAKKVIIQH